MKIGSLFTGYGGLDLAAEAIFDADTVWTSDVDPGACKIIARRYPDIPNLGDITAIDWTTVPPVDVLTGGFPCQDLSMAGRRAGMRPGTRSGLWQHMVYAIAQLQPRYVIAENVRGLLSGQAHSDVEPCPWCLGDGSESHLRALGAVLADLANLGYDTQWCGLRAADVGAPHGRFRVFILATDTRRQHGQRGPAAISGSARSRNASGEPERPAAAATDADRERIDRSGRARDRRPKPADSDRRPVVLLPTPTARDWKGHNQRRDDTCLTGALLPTPNAGLGEHRRDFGQDPKRRRAQGRQVSTADVLCHLLPTPTATPYGSNQSPSPGAAIRPSLDSLAPLLPTPMVGSTSPAAHGQISGQFRRQMDEALAQFGAYADVIARWQPVVGRPAPEPTINGRLSPLFVEWMMGLPDGWVTDVPGLTRAQQLKALGNGVVPQQAAAALAYMLDGDGRDSVL